MGDNLDKTIHPRIETSEHHAEGLHYFHGYAVKDRVDFTGLEDSVSSPQISQLNVDEVLPSADDELILKQNMAILATHEIQKYLPFFRKNIKPVMKHIPHRYSQEMSQKSEVVS